MEPIEEYSGLIPDEVLLKYDEAARSGLFAKFWIVTPTIIGNPRSTRGSWPRSLGPGSVRSSHGGTTCNLGDRYAADVAAV